VRLPEKLTLKLAHFRQNDVLHPIKILSAFIFHHLLYNSGIIKLPGKQNKKVILLIPGELRQAGGNKDFPGIRFHLFSICFQNDGD